MSVYDYILTHTNFVRKDDLKYPFEERGLQFGDGIYEVIRVYKGQYYLIEEHVERLYRSAEAVKIDIPFTKKEMYSHLDELLRKNSIDTDAKVYLQITRGSAPRDHAFPSNTTANLYAYVQDLPRKMDIMREGVSTITQPDVRWDWCYIKSLNLLPNVMAKQTASEAGCFEAILHKDGEITECSSSNVYLVRDGKVYTHPAKKNILHGCVRMKVEHFCKEEAIPFIEEAFRVEDIQYADELFLSSSTAEVTPITKVDGHLVNEGKPGPITRTIQQKYEQDAKIEEASSIFAQEV
ncbi:D-alanine aminotransferase [Halobacillus andaensis]|uniref:D-alanine aminotransferase n=1 Tax=Halobacillus andaensis TaxID=1176239 RepID=A0A917B2Y1_HALAA|nr:D-amino-acid transaminase [Halobacillus andaensis]MBP2004189.1 D-alanine transaminase [Halobacillus andaensis]GGF16481.1 D-alanine aminotransferase [Halobacillus andaensis]